MNDMQISTLMAFQVIYQISINSNLLSQANGAQHKNDFKLFLIEVVFRVLNFPSSACVSGAFSVFKI